MNMLRKIVSAPERLWMARHSQGCTTQEITAVWTGVEALVTARRVHQGEVTVRLEKEELAALVAWSRKHTGASGGRS